MNVSTLAKCMDILDRMENLLPCRQERRLKAVLNEARVHLLTVEPEELLPSGRSSAEASQLTQGPLAVISTSSPMERFSSSTVRSSSLTLRQPPVILLPTRRSSLVP